MKLIIYQQYNFYLISFDICLWRDIHYLHYIYLYYKLIYLYLSNLDNMIVKFKILH